MSMAVTDSGGTKMHLYGYDNTYQVTEVNYPVGYEYLATDTTYNYDAVGNRTSVIDTGGTTAYTTKLMLPAFVSTLRWLNCRNSLSRCSQSFMNTCLRRRAWSSAKSSHMTTIRFNSSISSVLR